uniref:Ig-like domain-containing protein n=1 Tax=Haplochromis burtoni TaxID=8153 RepID=A0A3Q2V6Y9_HAPBU
DVNLILTTALSIDGLPFYTVVVDPGQEITLQCSNFSSFATHIFWFRLADRLNASCISFMPTANSRATFCDGFQDTKFKMTSNTSVLFLEIKHVDSSDSGLYFCGELNMGRPKVYTATYLKVQADGLTNLSTVILGSLTVFLLLVIIGLVVSIRKLHTGIYVQSNWATLNLQELLSHFLLMLMPQEVGTLQSLSQQSISSFYTLG